jgi:uroporphyrinogen decarboxylase
MNKIERVDRVLSGEPVDRPPITLWYHFGVQHLGGEHFAKITTEFFDFYDFDYLKVMNDYFYQPPEGLEAVKTKDDLKRVVHFDVEQSHWQEQFKALEYISAELNGKAYFIDTVFDPWQSMRRNMAGENIEALMANEPDALLEALDVVADNLIDYCKKSLRIGTAGIFMSLYAASELISRENFLRFVKPPAVKVFKAIAGLGKMNTAHIHGEDLYFDDVLDLPVDIFSWWDRSSRGPSLGWVKERINGCVMGGINQKLVARTTREFLRNHVREAIELGGDTRFFLANGCSSDPWGYPPSMLAIVDETQKAGKSR